MTIKVTNCRDCIFRESHYMPDSPGYDTVDTCILLRKQSTKENRNLGFIAVYDSFKRNPRILKKRLPSCPLDKEQIIITI